MRKLIGEYWIELGAGLLAVLGVISVIVEPQIMRSALAIGLQVTGGGLNRLANGLSGWLERFSLADLAGATAALVALAFILWRIRYRFLNSDRWLVRQCPRCKGELVRVHRTRVDRFFSTVFLPHSRRYRCANPDCGWSGLRHHHPRLHRTSDTFSQPAGE